MREKGEAHLEKAKRFLRSARLLLDHDDPASSASRSYYAMYNAVQALLQEEGLEPSTHRGTIRLFGKHFVKDGPFPREMGQALHHGYDLREVGDYGGLFEVGAEEAGILLDEATILVDRIGEHLQTRTG